MADRAALPDRLRALAQTLAQTAAEMLATADELDGVRQCAVAPAEPLCDRLIAGYARAAEYLDEEQEAVRSAVRRGAIPCQRIGRRVLFTPSDLDAWRRGNVVLVEASQPVTAGSDRKRPLPALVKIGDDSGEM